MRKFGTLGLALVLLAWSLATIAIDSISKPNLEIARRLEAGSKPDESYIYRVQAPDPRQAMVFCPRELVRSAVTIKLVKLQAIARAGAEPKLMEALAEVDAFVRKGLSCFPSDGNLWLRLAVVQLALNGPTVSVEKMLELSARAAPSEA